MLSSEQQISLFTTARAAAAAQPQVPADKPRSRPRRRIMVRVRAPQRRLRHQSQVLERGQCVLVGTAPECDLKLPDAGAGAYTCRLTNLGDRVELTAAESPNGVFIGDVKVMHAQLPPRFSFRIAKSVIELRRDGESAEMLLPGLVGCSPAMRRLATQVDRCAVLSVPTLLRGESGSGKELVARALHERSSRADGPFVVISAATLSSQLAGSELFGHRKGAFTGAEHDRLGAFRSADGGTLFIDEIATLPPQVQAKLLRVVEEQAVQPIGSDSFERVDVRLLTATSEPLEEMVQDRRFRADLYSRLATCVVWVPPLRERLEDIPLLAEHLLLTSELGARRLDCAALERLSAFGWPGNVRELRNVLIQAAVLSDDNLTIHAADVEKVMQTLGVSRRRRPKPELGPLQAREIVSQARGNVSAAARHVGLPRSTFRDRLKAAGRHR